MSKPEEAKPSLGQKFLGTAEALEAAWAQKTINPLFFWLPGPPGAPKTIKPTVLAPPGAVPAPLGVVILGPSGQSLFGAVRARRRLLRPLGAKKP